MPNVNYAAEYSRALAQAYPYLSYFPEIWGANNSNLYRPGMGKTMYIPTLSVSGAHSAGRDSITGAFSRNWDNSLQAVTLEMDREWETLVDPMDIEETNMVASVANVTKAFNEQQKVPEMDAYLAAKLAAVAENTASNPTNALSASNILTIWDSMVETLINARCNLSHAVCYMRPFAHNMLKISNGINRYVNVIEGAGQGEHFAVSRMIGKLDGIPIRVVPDTIMKTAFDFTTGWAAASGAKQVDMLLVCTDSVAAPVKYETSMVSEPSAQSKGKYLYYERYYYGAFKLSERGGIVKHVAP